MPTIDDVIMKLAAIASMEIEHAYSHLGSASNSALPSYLGASVYFDPRSDIQVEPADGSETHEIFRITPERGPQQIALTPERAGLVLFNFWRDELLSLKVSNDARYAEAVRIIEREFPLAAEAVGSSSTQLPASEVGHVSPPATVQPPIDSYTSAQIPVQPSPMVGQAFSGPFDGQPYTGIPQNPSAPYFPPGMAQRKQNTTLAIVLEIVCGLFGLFGIGWLISGYTQTGIILLVGGLVWGAIAIVIAFITVGLGLFCTWPISLVVAITSTILLTKKLEQSVPPICSM